LSLRGRVDGVETARVDCAAVEQVARPVLSEAHLQMAPIFLSKTRSTAPIPGAVGGRGVPTSR